MKAIILAAGKWTRLLPITENIPKAMVEVFWKSLLEHNMDCLAPYVNEFIIVVKYKKEAIIKYFGDTYKWIPIRYHEQWEKYWTGWAMIWIECDDDIFIMYGDNVFEPRDIKNIITSKYYGSLVCKTNNPEKYGIYHIGLDGFALEMIEKSQEYIWNLANLWGFKLSSVFLEYIKETPLSQRGEYELVEALNKFIAKNKFKVIEIRWEFLDITSIEDLEAANTLTKPELWKTRYLESIWAYEVHLGIPKTWIQKIVDYSTDETDTALREGTSDWKKRFISVENLTSWYHDTDRYPFTLLSQDWVVAGLWWGRPAKLPNITEVLNHDQYDIMTQNSHNIHTSGIRIYPFARWERLASPFMNACEKYYSSIFDDIYMSDDVWAENIPSQKAFERLWYQKVWYGKNVNNSPESEKQRFVYMKKF